MVKLACERVAVAQEPFVHIPHLSFFHFFTPVVMDKLRSSGSEALWSVHRLPDRSSLAPTLHEHGVAIVELSDAWIGHCEEMRVSCEEFFTLPSDLRRKVCVEVRPDTDGPLLDSAFVGKRTATGRDRLEVI